MKLDDIKWIDTAANKDPNVEYVEVCGGIPIPDSLKPKKQEPLKQKRERKRK